MRTTVCVSIFGVLFLFLSLSMSSKISPRVFVCVNLLYYELNRGLFCSKAKLTTRHTNSPFKSWRRHHDTQHNDTQPNNFQHNDTQLNGLICETRQKWHSAYKTRSITKLSVSCALRFIIVMLNLIIPSIVRYAECGSDPKPTHQLGPSNGSLLMDRQNLQSFWRRRSN
jgi:hypothetical protein